MQSNINERELKVLAYMHEAATGYGLPFMFDLGAMNDALKLSEAELAKALSYLAEHRLVSVDWSAPRTFRRDVQIRPAVVSLSGLGEDYMREVERRLAEKTAGNAFKTVGLKVVTETWDVLKDVAATVLSEIVVRKTM